MEQTLMGDADFANAMVPPSPPRNMSEMAIASSVTALPGAAAGAGAGIAAHQGRRKVTIQSTAPSNAVPPSAMAGKEKDAKKNGAAVPKLKIASSAPVANAADSDEDEIQDYEYSVPLSERETALTARDRDLIEQGDWSEIHDELSDNDFSLVGHRGSDGHKPEVLSSLQKGSKGVSIAPVGSGAVQNPRGGRHYRSPMVGIEEQAGNTNGSNTSATSTGSNHHAARLQGQQNFKSHSGGFQIEDSDEDSTYGNPSTKNPGGKKGSNSPRRAVDKLDPIPLPLYDEPGILSGRRIEKPILSARGNPSAVAPAPSGGGGFALVYPSLGGGRSERAEKERADKFSHIVTGSGAAGGGGKRDEDWPAVEERAKKESNYKLAAQQPAAGGVPQSRYPRRGSRGQLDEETEAAMMEAAVAAAPSAVEAPPLMIGENVGGAVGRSGKGSVARNAALGRLKAHNPPSNTSSSANINSGASAAADNAEFSLNVYGNAFGGGAGGGAGPVGAPLDAVRPANKNIKANAR
jgi:hypothetical protein